MARHSTTAPGFLLLLVLTLLTTACGGVINPPVPPTRPAPPPPRPTWTPEPSATTEPTATPEPERWVKNHRITPMWSAPQGAPGAVSFGNTSSAFCSFRVVEEADNARILVYNPYNNGTFWIDAEAVGPVVEPPHRAGPKPIGVNCTEAVYDGRSIVLPDATSTATTVSTGTVTLTPTVSATTTPTGTATAASIGPAATTSTGTATPAPILTPTPLGDRSP